MLMATAILAVIGCLWPSFGICDNAAGRWLIGRRQGASVAAANSKRALIVLNREHPDADYAALPSGARFLGPDGVNRREP